MLRNLSSVPKRRNVSVWTALFVRGQLQRAVVSPTGDGFAVIKGTVSVLRSHFNYFRLTETFVVE